MRVPFGWASLVVGGLGFIVYLLGRIQGGGRNFELLVASVAAFVAGYIACFELPRLEARIKDLSGTRGDTPIAGPSAHEE